jgi:hypothetical protein
MQVPSRFQALPLSPETGPQMSWTFWCAPLHACVPADEHGQPSDGVVALQPLIGTQLPVMHTMPAAQAELSGAFPFCTQTCWPVEHE